MYIYFQLEQEAVDPLDVCDSIPFQLEQEAVNICVCMAAEA